MYICRFARRSFLPELTWTERSGLECGAVQCSWAWQWAPVYVAWTPTTRRWASPLRASRVRPVQVSGLRYMHWHFLYSNRQYLILIPPHPMQALPWVRRARTDRFATRLSGGGPTCHWPRVSCGPSGTSSGILRRPSTVARRSGMRYGRQPPRPRVLTFRWPRPSWMGLTCRFPMGELLLTNVTHGQIYVT